MTYTHPGHGDDTAGPAGMLRLRISEMDPGFCGLFCPAYAAKGACEFGTSRQYCLVRVDDALGLLHRGLSNGLVPDEKRSWALAEFQRLAKKKEG